MPRETIRTNDAELYVGWPTTDDDAERDRSVQVGARFGDSVAWVTLTSPDQVADFRRTLQRASRRVWPQDALTPPSTHQDHCAGAGQCTCDPPFVFPPLHPVGDPFDGDLVVPSPFGPVATGLVTPAPTDEPA